MKADYWFLEKYSYIEDPFTRLIRWIKSDLYHIPEGSVIPDELLVLFGKIQEVSGRIGSPIPASFDPVTRCYNINGRVYTEEFLEDLSEKTSAPRDVGTGYPKRDEPYVSGGTPS